MRLSLRFVVPLLLVLAAVAWGLAPAVDRLLLGWFVRDIDNRATLVARAIQSPLAVFAADGAPAPLRAFLSRLTADERLYAVGYCPDGAADVVGTPGLPPTIHCDDVAQFALPGSRTVEHAGGALRVTPVRVPVDGPTVGTLLLVHDMRFASQRSAETRRLLFGVFIGLGVLVSLITVAVAQLSWRGWVDGLRALTRGDWLLQPSGKPAPSELRPVARDLRALIRDIESAHRLPDAGDIPWSAEALRGVLGDELRGQQVMVVANREPFIHTYEGKEIVVRRPASGLVTALEPVMRACSGVWIAHGSGSADREVVDRHDRIEVPPEDPTYRLRRVWIGPEAERGYYYGFANEGLWPLCHIAHVRPTFRTSDWEHYTAVNELFADAVAEEADSPDPIVLVQDYHFALLPRMIRERLPAATIITFWHIPWPNPEAFAICPWRQELLDGLLGSSILGFHTQFHCNNFVDTVDRLLEARVDRETQSVSFRGASTAIRRYPIAIEWPTPKALLSPSIDECRARLRCAAGLPADQAVAVAVDRLDYTKGIEERFRAVERLLERYPEWRGRFTLFQIAAPTRSSIGQYLDYQVRVAALASRINERFAGDATPPIVLRIAHHEPREVYEAYRAADACFVSSLHDGMNLVAKEFVAARDDERGVLILSRFTGAARELPEALVVNPYDSDECASALHAALRMPASEQRDRMRLMRGLLREFNVYRWAGRMLIDAAELRRRARLQARAFTVAAS